MPSYTPPLRDMRFVLHEVLGVVDEFKQLPAHAEVDAETIDAVLEEAGKFASEVLAPLNAVGDAEGCTLDREARTVRTPKGFKEAYATFVEGGWPALSADPAFGGQGLPHVVNQAFFEMLNSANQAWTMYPGLAHGAYECLREHGSEAQKALYLPRMQRKALANSAQAWRSSHCAAVLRIAVRTTPSACRVPLDTNSRTEA